MRSSPEWRLMAHQVSCPECRTAITLRDAEPGTRRKIRCPMCTQFFVAVIGGAADARTQAARPPVEPRPAKPKPAQKKRPMAEEEEPEPLIRRPGGRSRQKSGSPIVLILVVLFLVF